MGTITPERTRKKSGFVRTIAIWTAASLILQAGLYTFLNHSISKVMNPTSLTATPAPTTMDTVLPDTDLRNVQLSYDRKYISYLAGNAFKVFDIAENKVVFTKEPESGSDEGMGVLNYQWLADRDSLIYFYAKKNGGSSKSKTNAAASSKPSSSTNKSSSSKSSTRSSAPSPKASVKAKTTSSSSNTIYAMPLAFQAEDSFGTDSVPPASTAKEKAASASPSAASGNSKSSQSTPVPIGAQITELDALDLSAGSASPNDRHYLDLGSFPAGGQILEIASSTYTNLIHITVKTGSTIRLMEIDINNNSKFLQTSGTIADIASSDKFGTLYIQSDTGKTKQITSVNGSKRSTVTTDNNDIILGTRDGTLYLGQVNNDRLVKIMSAAESSDNSQTVDLQPIWSGDIPYNDEKSIIGSDGQIILYGSKTAYVFKDGKSQTVNFNGDKNYISADGTEKIELTKDGSQTKIAVNPLSN